MDTCIGSSHTILYIEPREVRNPSGRDADKLVFARYKDESSASYAITFKNPLPFKTFFVVFDPLTTYFDWYQVQVQYSKYSNPSLPASKKYFDKGKPIVDNPGKNMIVFGGNNLDYSSKPYPVAGRSANYIEYITVQFFIRRPISDVNAGMFDSIRTNAQFGASGAGRRTTALDKYSGWNVGDVSTWIG